MPSQYEIRQAAALAGDTRYSSGKPCKRGHVAERYVSNGACVQCLHIPTALSPLQSMFTFPLPIAASATNEQRLACEVYLTKCMELFWENAGLPLPIKTAALQWVQSYGKPLRECPL